MHDRHRKCVKRFHQKNFKGLDTMPTLIQSLESVILQLLRLSAALGLRIPSPFTPVVRRFSEKTRSHLKILDATRMVT
jgi:hypothetical protein